MTEIAPVLRMVGATEAPCSILVPSGIEEMHEKDAKTRAERIAWVLLMVEPAEQHSNQHTEVSRNGHQMSARQFAEQGFWGLSSPSSVLALHTLGTEMVAAGLMDQPAAGKLCKIPTNAQIKEFIKAKAKPVAGPSEGRPVDTGESQPIPLTGMSDEQADWDEDEPSPEKNDPAMGQEFPDDEVRPLPPEQRQLLVEVVGLQKMMHPTAQQFARLKQQYSNNPAMQQFVLDGIDAVIERFTALRSSEDY